MMREETVSEEQVLFNKLKYEEQQFILRQMKLLQPCELIEEEKKIPEKMDRELNCDDDTLRGLVASVNEIYKEIADKYNEIIDYLKSKGE